AALGLGGIGALLLERVLDLEQVGEVAARIEADAQIHGLVGMVEDRQLLVEAVADGAAPDHRQLRVDVDRPGAGDEKEARLEVLEVVDRQRIHPLAVDRQDPLREEARVVREEAGRIGERRLDVSARVADHERVAVEDLDAAVAHGVFLAGCERRRRAGFRKSRRRSTIRRSSPPMPTSPRSTAAIRFSLPAIARSKLERSTRRMQSAATFLRETPRLPLSMVTRQRSVRLPSVMSKRALLRGLAGRARRKTQLSDRAFAPPRGQPSDGPPQRRRPDGMRGTTENVV